MKRPLLVLLMVLVGAGALLALRSRPPKVEVTRPVARQVTESIAVTGTLAGRDESDVVAEVSGRLRRLDVKEGQRVKQGLVLARLDQALALARLEEAEARVRTARAALAQAQEPALAAQRRIVKAEGDQALGVARQQLAAAEARLDQLQRGPTREEREQVRGESRQALLAWKQREAEARRLGELLGQGFATRQEAEQARTQARVAEQQYRTADNRRRQLEIGPREEEIRQARAQRDQAAAEWRAAQQLAPARLENLDATPRPVDVDVALSQVREAEAGLRVAQQTLRQTEVRAPFNGTVTRLLLKPGEMVTPQTPLLHLVSAQPLEVQAYLDEVHLDRVRVAQRAELTSDTYPGVLPARVREIAPQVRTERGSVLLRLDPDSAPAWFRPGLTVSVNLLFGPAQERLVVPLTSVTLAGRESRVLVLEQGLLKERNVEVGAPTVEGFPVLSGLKSQDLVVTNRAGLTAGQRAREG